MKNFTNNFKQFTSRLSARWLIMALMLLLGTSSAWALNQPAKDLYFDNSTSQWTNCYVYIGHGSHTSCYDMSRVSGTQYLWKLPSNFNGGNSWDNADGWVVCKEKWWSSKGESIYKFVHHGDKNVTDITKSAWEDNKIYKTNGTGNVTHDNKTTNVYKITSITKSNYTVTIKSETGGTLTVKDYDDYTVSTGASKIYLTVLKFSASASTGYNFTEVQIYDGSTTTTISAANLTSQTYTLTSNVTITPVWEKACTPSATLSSANYDAVNNEIDLSGSIVTCGKELFYGFLWKNKEDANWNTANAISGTGGNNNKTKENKEFAHSWNGFTPGTTYEFTAYALDATTNPYTWYYSTNENDVIEVSTCTSIPDNAYAIAKDNVWTGNENPVTINYDANTYGTPTILYDGEEQISTKVGTYAITINVPAYNGYCASTISLGNYEITCINVEKPNITTSATICAGTEVTLSAYNNSNTVKWYSNSACAEEVTQPVTPNNGKVYYAKAYHEASGCYSSEYSTLTFTVNPLPIISISGSEEAVLYEDVTLTATGTNIDAVNWIITNGTGTLSNTTGTSVKLTSSTAGTVKVKATATSENDCTKESNELSVTFANETCNNVADMTKIYFDTKGNSNFNDNVYLSVAGNKYNKDRSADCINTGHAGDYWPGEDGTFHKMTKIAGTNIYYVNKPASIPSGKISIWNKNQQGNNNVWQAHVILAKSIDNNNNCLVLGSSSHHKDRQSDVYCSTWTTYKNAPAISAPAVKTVSFETTPGDGNINFSGQIVKTGCDNSLTYGYEYKKVGAANWTQVVLGTDLDKDAGFTFSDNNDKDLDGEYVVRAFITNDNSTQYGAEITKELSTTKDPVTEATITLTDAEGKEVDKKYCVGETAYIMVESDVKYTEISWKSQQGVDIVQTRLMNMYQFVVKGNDNIVVLLSNKYNVTPAESNTKEVYTFADPILPRVSLNKVSICSNDEVGATVKLTNVVKGQTYQLYQQIENAGGSFTEQAIGEAKTQTEEVTDKTELVLHTLTNTAATGKYFVKTYTTVCEENIVATQPFTFTVVDAAEVFISIDPASAETTPWMPAKFTVNASDKYTLNVTKGIPAEPATEVEVSQNGNKVSVKIPLPQGSTLPEGTTGVYGQYENVVFPQGATTQYTITATLSAAGGDNPCAAPANATINLVPYEEECTKGH